jgi:hypothetical protein
MLCGERVVAWEMCRNTRYLARKSKIFGEREYSSFFLNLRWGEISCAK